MTTPVFVYCGLIFLVRPQIYKKRIEYLERRAEIVIKSDNATIVLRIPMIDRASKNRACTIVFDNVQSNFCCIMRGHFTKNTNGKVTRKDEISAKLSQQEQKLDVRELTSWLERNATACLYKQGKSTLDFYLNSF